MPKIPIKLRDFNPRSPRGGATRLQILTKTAGTFQSTLPTRGSDYIVSRRRLTRLISIHAPHEGERRIGLLNVGSFVTFQSTLPTRGSDCVEIVERKSMQVFQSTLPTRGSDVDVPDLLGMTRISIHAPHEGERPVAVPPPWAGLRDFNPRSPRGGATCTRTR